MLYNLTTFICVNLVLIGHMRTKKFVPIFHVNYVTMIWHTIIYVSKCMMSCVGCSLIDNKVSLSNLMHYSATLWYLHLQSQTQFEKWVKHFCLWTTLPCLQPSSEWWMLRQLHDWMPHYSYFLHTNGPEIQAERTCPNTQFGLEIPILWTTLLWTTLPLFIPISANLACTSVPTSPLLFLYIKKWFVPIAMQRPSFKATLLLKKVFK